MTKQKQNSGLALITLILIILGIGVIFASNQILIGIGLLAIGLVIILLKAMWANAVWADKMLHRWTAKNLAPEDDVDITFTVEEEKKDE